MEQATKHGQARREGNRVKQVSLVFIALLKQMTILFSLQTAPMPSNTN